MSNEEKKDGVEVAKAEFEKHANGGIFPSTIAFDSVLRINHLGIKDFELYSAMVLCAMIENGGYKIDLYDAQAMGIALAKINRSLEPEFSNMHLNHDQKNIISGLKQLENSALAARVDEFESYKKLSLAMLIAVWSIAVTLISIMIILIGGLNG